MEGEANGAQEAAQDAQEQGGEGRAQVDLIYFTGCMAEDVALRQLGQNSNRIFDLLKQPAKAECNLY
ncbi:hypothetical protein [Eggerthella guodeyinii]|uniref:Uncharacterized protein n=1 Tax=Eggerthella guodeyinii TaxID=2690837 RepID=A0A6N7RK19_9ACTN|nr:hypothetical protein [Eggerthella guodeyinii]MRX81098.1 hypothetical protein [Eggerthella guodeyinii]